MKVEPYTLDSDADLYCEYMKTYHNCYVPKEMVEKFKLVPFETITRIRRKICKLPQFKASKEVEEHRQQKYEEMKAEYSWVNPLRAVQEKWKSEKKEQPVLPV